MTDILFAIKCLNWTHAYILKDLLLLVSTNGISIPFLSLDLGKSITCRGIIYLPPPSSRGSWC